VYTETVKVEPPVLAEENARATPGPSASTREQVLEAAARRLSTGVPTKVVTA
jgi:hypothetical protein